MKRTCLLTLLALLLAATAALAAPDSKKQGGANKDHRSASREMRHGPDGGPPFAELDLSDAQKAKLKEQRDKHQEAFIDHRANMQKAELRLRQALETQPIDEVKLKSAREDLVKLQTQQLDFRIAQMRFFLSILTPEQRKKFDAAVAENGPEDMPGPPGDMPPPRMGK